MAKNAYAKQMIEGKKKFERDVKISFEAGVSVGFEEGFEQAAEMFSEVLRNTRGVGDKIHSSVMQEARQEIRKRYTDRDGNTRPEVLKVRDFLRKEDKSDRGQ